MPQSPPNASATLAPGSVLAMDAEGKLSTADYAVLGLIAQLGGEAHGYELARHFQRHELLGDVIHLEPAMLYKCLKKLVKYALIELTPEPNDGRPPRQVSHLTPAGRQALDHWLATPVQHTRDVRLTFLVKLYFGRLLSPAREATLIQQQHAVMLELVGSLRRQLRDQFPAAAPDSPERDLRRQVISLRLVQTEAVATWLATLAAPGKEQLAGAVSEDTECPYLEPGMVMAGQDCPAMTMGTMREVRCPRCAEVSRSDQ